MHFEFDINVLDIVSILATICTIALYLTPVQTCRKIMRKGSSSDSAFFPYVAMFSTCTLWLKYGLLKEDRTLILVNGTGAVLTFSYMVIYVTYTMHRNQIFKQIIGACCIILPMLTFVQYYTEDRSSALKSLGRFCAMGSITSYGSPLASMAKVFQTQSTECMAYSLSLANFIVAAEWALYGYFLFDFYIIIPNVLGVGLAMIQLALFYIYPEKKMGPVIIS